MDWSSACPKLCLGRLHGPSVEMKIVEQALDERDVLLRQLHEMKQSPVTMAGDLVSESIDRLERCVNLLKQAKDADHG